MLPCHFVGIPCQLLLKLLYVDILCLFLRGAFSLFSSVAFLLRSLVFLRFSFWTFPNRLVW